MFEWDEYNLRKIRAHQVTSDEAEQALLNDPVLVHEQDVEGESRFVYYGETNARRLLAVVVTERGNSIRVITSYDLASRQRRSYMKKRALGEQTP